MNVFELFGTIAINNRDANSALTDTATKAERTGSRIQAAFKNIGSTALKIGKVVGTGVMAMGTAIVAGVESTRDYRGEMAKLTTAFTTNGFSAEAAKNTYKRLQAVLGETDQAVEAAGHLAVMVKNEEDLAKWTDICTGVYATFGASLPIEGLTESANETSKVGQVTGSLADALNWAGISEDDFNKKLAACTSDAERQDLIMNTLYWTYKAASDQYQETGKSVMEANEAQDRLTEAMSNFWAVFEPIVTKAKLLIANAINASIPYIESLIGGIVAIASSADEAWLAVQNFCTQHIVDPISSTLSAIGSGFESVIEWANAASGAIAAFFGIQRSNYMPTQSTDEYFAPPSGLGEYANGWNGGYTTSGADIQINNAGAVGSFASGLDRVPHDGYLARLHKDEAILNSREAAAWRGGGYGRTEALLSELVGIMRAGQVIQLDSGIMAGQLTPAIDARMGTIARHKGRGN